MGVDVPLPLFHPPPHKHVIFLVEEARGYAVDAGEHAAVAPRQLGAEAPSGAELDRQGEGFPGSRNVAVRDLPLARGNRLPNRGPPVRKGTLKVANVLQVSP